MVVLSKTCQHHFIVYVMTCTIVCSIVKISQEPNTMNTIYESLGTRERDKLITVTLMYGSYFMCVNKNGYNFLGSMSAMCNVKPWRVLLP